MSPEELHGSLKSHEHRLVEHGEELKNERTLQAHTNLEETFKKKDKNKEKWRHEVNKKDVKEDNKKETYFQQKKGHNFVRNVKGYNCNKLDHIANYCWKPN